MGEIHLIKSLGANRRLGQNFLVNGSAIERELAYCLPKGKRILEIGPGLGALSEGLAKEAEEYTAVEIDERFIPILEERIRKYPKARAIQGDILDYNPENQGFDLIVSNIPYYIASKILLKISEFDFISAVVCIQAELAERMLANPGTRDYSRLSVVSQLLFEVERLETFPRNFFYPQPKVDSTLLRLEKRGSIPEPMSVFINSVFQHRNKKLRNAIVDSRGLLGLSTEKAPVLASTMSLGERRVISLSIEEVVSSYKEFRRAIH